MQFPGDWQAYQSRALEIACLFSLPGRNIRPKGSKKASNLRGILQKGMTTITKNLQMTIKKQAETTGSLKMIADAWGFERLSDELDAAARTNQIRRMFLLQSGEFVFVRGQLRKAHCFSRPKSYT